MLLLGYAWQQGLVPVSAAALDQAIELNGAAVEANRRAFAWGRRVALFPERVAEVAGPLVGAAKREMTVNELIEHRSKHLTDYQDHQLAERYRQRLKAVLALGDNNLTRIVATQYARLLAPKDEYEVARLYTESDFLSGLQGQFAGDTRLLFHFAPPLVSRPGLDGRPKKIRFGAWLLPALRILAKARRLRGSWLYPFRFGTEKALDHRLLADYEADLDLIAARPDKPPEATDLASWPAEIRGFGPIRAQAASQVATRREKARTALMA
jgi:indolepyruvate ferredoxin oxidoreductase